MVEFWEIGVNRIGYINVFFIKSFEDSEFFKVLEIDMMFIGIWW